jgi:GH25 family lysozyme M1 (1,4-beta-N-acetylmuramidase)
VLRQGFVLLSAGDTDAPQTPAVAVVSKEDAGDDGGFALGAAAAARGALVVDRPYVTGNPTVGWFVERADRATEAGMWCQVLNELNLEMEGFVGGPEAYFAFEDALRLVAADPERLLAMPPSPGVPGWEAWVRPEGHHAVHAYGSCAQMTDIVQWYVAHTAGDIYLSEINFGAGNTVDVDTWAATELVPFLDWCAGQERVKCCAYFAWRWRTPDSTLTTPLDAAGTAIETVIRDWTPPDPPAQGAPDPGPEEDVLEGVDASNWQAEVDWTAVAASGRRFAIVKASEDGDYRDPYFAGNWRGIKDAGMVRGAYHFARPSQVDPITSVALFAEQIAAAGGLDEGDLIALDLEDADVPAGEQLAGWALDWLAEAEEVLNVRPLLYSGVWFMEPHGLMTSAILATYPLWLAAYQDEPPPAPPEWETVTIWQYSAHGVVPGVQGDCDLNQFLGDEAALAAIGYAGTGPDPVQPLRDTTWALCDNLQDLASQWTDAGWASTGSGIASAAEAVKTIIRSTQGEK